MALSSATDEELASVAESTFEKYYLAATEHMIRFRQNDFFYQNKEWELAPAGKDGSGVKPHTSSLWATCDNIHADLNGAYPRPLLEAQTSDDADKADRLSRLAQSVLKRRGFRKTWDDLTGGVIQQGTDVLEVFWDPQLYRGRGDVNIQRWSIKNFLFDPQVADIQDSPAVIKYRFVNTDRLRALYPKLADQIGAGNALVHPEDTTAAPEKNYNREDLSLEYDFWWKEFDEVVENDEDGSPLRSYVKVSLHWAKIAGGVVVKRLSEPGKSVYAHGLYPFVPIAFDPIEGSVYGLGLIDRFKQDQGYIDSLNAAILMNAYKASKLKLLVNKTARIDKKDLQDWSVDIVEGERIGEDAVRWLSAVPFPNAQMQFVKDRKESMKEDSGQNEFVRGEGGRGVTAAAAIKSLQEAGNKRIRQMINRLFYGTGDALKMAVQVMAQFYDDARLFQITEDGEEMTGEITREDFFGADQELIDFDVTMNVEVDPGYVSTYNNAIFENLIATRPDMPFEVMITMLDFPRKQEFMKKLRQYKGDEVAMLKEQLEQMGVELAEARKNQAYIPQNAGAGRQGNVVPMAR
jgi:hypothetical protein